MSRAGSASGWSEERLLRWLRALPLDARRARGVRGHDAAVLPASSARTVVAVDQTIEGVHFEPGTPAARIASKAIGRVFSDLAATAATPRAAVCALGAPRSTSEVFLRTLLRRLRERARALEAELVGGDLAARPGPLSVTVTGIGLLPGRATPPGRHRARPGDRVLLTGPVGGSLLGRHLAVRPRVAEGRWLHAHGARALMDVSDGLARDLARLAATSGVRIDLEHVPVHPDARRLARRTGRSPLAHALHDGEDHELLAVLSPRDAERALATRSPLAPRLIAIGRVRRGSGLRLPDERGRLHRWDGSGGWVHGT